MTEYQDSYWVYTKSNKNNFNTLSEAKQYIGKLLQSCIKLKIWMGIWLKQPQFQFTKKL